MELNGLGDTKEVDNEIALINANGIGPNWNSGS